MLFAFSETRMTFKSVFEISLEHPICQKSYWPRGRVLGGTSNLNSMLYIRGSRHDYDAWAKDGCDGWSYKEVLPYFIKSEDNQNEEYVKSGEFKG